MLPIYIHQAYTLKSTNKKDQQRAQFVFHSNSEVSHIRLLHPHSKKS